jgi:hypothetical protein
MRNIHAARRSASAIVAAFILVLASLGLGLAASPVAAATLVAEEGSAEPTPDPTPAEPEPSDSPEPPSPSPAPPTPTSDPSPPPVEESDPSTPSSNEPADTDTSEPLPTDSTDPKTSSFALAPSLSAEQFAALSTDVADVVALAVPFPGTVSTFVSAAQVLAGEPFYDLILFVASDPFGIFVDTLDVTFSLFGPDDETCSGAPAFASNVMGTIGIGGIAQLQVFHEDDPAIMTQPGTYRFVVSYTLTQPLDFDIEGQTACNDPNESVVVLAPPDPGGDDDDDDDGDDDDSDEDSEDDSEDDSDEDSDEDSDDEAAALPDTGAADNLQLIGGTGIGLTILGMFMVIATPRRRASSHRA